MPKLIRNAEPTVLITVSGRLDSMSPARNRPGCILALSNGHSTGHYYVPLQPHDCRAEFQEGSNITFRVWASAVPDKDTGVIDTAGTVSRLWTAAK